MKKILLLLPVLITGVIFALLKYDELHWQWISFFDQESGYVNYLKKHEYPAPHGNHTSEARHRLGCLQEPTMRIVKDQQLKMIRSSFNLTATLKDCRGQIYELSAVDLATTIPVPHNVPYNELEELFRYVVTIRGHGSNDQEYKHFWLWEIERIQRKDVGQVFVLRSGETLWAQWDANINPYWKYGIKFKDGIIEYKREFVRGMWGDNLVEFPIGLIDELIFTNVEVEKQKFLDALETVMKKGRMMKVYLEKEIDYWFRKRVTVGLGYIINRAGSFYRTDWQFQLAPSAWVRKETWSTLSTRRTEGELPHWGGPLCPAPSQTFYIPVEAIERITRIVDADGKRSGEVEIETNDGKVIHGELNMLHESHGGFWHCSPGDSGDLVVASEQGIGVFRLSEIREIRFFKNRGN